MVDDAPKGVRKASAPDPERRAPLILRPRVMTRRGHMPRASCGLRVPLLVRLRLDPDENGAPERVELSRAGAPSASQFGFHALDRVLRPEPRDQSLDAAPKGAHEDTLFLWRGREVAVAIDLGHRVASAFGRAEVISPAAEKSTPGWLRAPSSRSRNARLVADGELLRDETRTASCR